MASEWTINQLKTFHVEFDAADTDKSGKLRFREVVFLLAKNGFRGNYQEAKVSEENTVLTKIFSHLF